MIKWCWQIIYLGILLFLLTQTNFAKTNSQNPKFSDLTLEFAVSKQNIVQFEPIIVSVKLINNTKFPILGHKDLDFADGKIRLLISHETFQKEISHITGVTNLSLIEPEIIQPNEKVESRQIWFANLAFPTPGTYNVQAVLTNVGTKDEIKSNTIKVRIIEPQERDIEALNYIKQHSDNGPAYYHTINVLNRKDLEDFVIQFQNSVYWEYLSCALVNTYFVKRDYEQAITVGEKLLEKQDFQFDEEVLHILVESSITIHNVDKARKYFNQLKLHYPKSGYVVARQGYLPFKDLSPK